MVFDENFIDKNIAELCKNFALIHGSNVNLTRIAPDFVDGVKLVARRMLYVMYLKDKGRSIRKVATITGDVIGRLHMHGPSSVYTCLVGLAQPWNNNIPLIEGLGNYGSICGDPAGADRYIQARLSEYAYDCFFADWKESAVDMVMGADNETMEPLYLPAKYPNVLINGSLGIGYGMASNLPPFNFKEVVEATIKLMKNPDAHIMLIPDSPSGADMVESNFHKICDQGSGVYTMRCKYEILSEDNIIKITNLPYQITVNSIREKIADIKERNGLAELKAMDDFSGAEVDLRLTIRDDINPYKFMKKLIEEIAGLEKTYPVNITVTNDYETFDYSIRQLLLEWIRYRREQKRVIISHKRTTLLAEQRTNDVKIFLLSQNNLDETLKIFRTSRNREIIEKELIHRYHNSEIKMDSLQAKTLSGMKFYELCIDNYNECIKRRDELLDDIAEVEDILNSDNGIDELIIAELREGIKKYGCPRRSNVVPRQISIATEIEGNCILQLSADGNILRKTATNVDEEPVPTDINGFAVKVENDEGFIAVDEDGKYSFIKVNEIPVDNEVPLNRYIKGSLSNIVALLPFDIDSNKCCTLISKKGILKKIKISEMRASKKPCIELNNDDKLVAGIITNAQTVKDILIYTDTGRGQRLDPNNIRITSSSAKGLSGFKLSSDENIIGCFAINPENQYLLYITTKGKVRLNLTEYLPMRNSKNDSMVNLISLPERDRLFRVVGCNKLDKLQVFFNDGDSEIININKISIGTMSTEPKKVTKKNAVSNYIVKVKLI